MKTSKVNKLKYDLATTTLNDFAVEMDITEADWQDFLDNHYHPKGEKAEKSPSLYLKQYLKKRIEEVLSKSYQSRELAKIEEVERNSVG